MPRVSANGIRLHYEETGAGVPLVFVHEFAGDAQSWHLQVRFFARRYRTIAFNARGYPPSDVPTDGSAYSQDHAVDDIRGLLDALGIEDPYDLTGLYHGRPIGEKSSMESGALPDRIHLYRRAILDEWVATGVGLTELVRHVTIHEIGHHFGLSDADMHALEATVQDQ